MDRSDDIGGDGVEGCDVSKDAEEVSEGIVAVLLVIVVVVMLILVYGIREKEVTYSITHTYDKYHTNHSTGLRTIPHFVASITLNDYSRSIQ